MTLAGPFPAAVAAIVGLSLLGLPIGHSMIGGSVLYLLLAGLDMGTAAEQLLNGMYRSEILLAIPLFILAAEFMNTGSITERLLRFCDALVGRFRGGLAHVNVVQSIIFAGMSGSALADAAASGKLMQKMMTQDGKYPAAFAAALTAASSVMGPIIPPSIPLVVYALIADTSVGYLFLGGVVPGLLVGIAQMALIAFVAKRRNFPVEPPTPLRDLPGITWQRVPRAPDARGAPRRHLQRRDHAHGSRRGRRRLLAASCPPRSIGASAGETSTTRCSTPRGRARRSAS